MAYDGTNIWVTNRNSASVSKINPSTGAKFNYSTDYSPEAVVYDGTNIWVANYSSHTVSKLVP